MPSMDGTGPEGKGPKTGRQMGKCKGAEPQSPRGRFGQGRGFGRRLWGRGFGRRFEDSNQE